MNSLVQYSYLTFDVYQGDVDQLMKSLRRCDYVNEEFPEFSSAHCFYKCITCMDLPPWFSTRPQLGHIDKVPDANVCAHSNSLSQV